MLHVIGLVVCMTSIEIDEHLKDILSAKSDQLEEQWLELFGNTTGRGFQNLVRYSPSRLGLPCIFPAYNRYIERQARDLKVKYENAIKFSFVSRQQQYIRERMESLGILDYATVQQLGDLMTHLLEHTALLINGWDNKDVDIMSSYSQKKKSAVNVLVEAGKEVQFRAFIQEEGKLKYECMKSKHPIRDILQTSLDSQKTEQPAIDEVDHDTPANKRVRLDGTEVPESEPVDVADATEARESEKTSGSGDAHAITKYHSLHDEFLLFKYESFLASRGCRFLADTTFGLRPLAFSPDMIHSMFRNLCKYALASRDIAKWFNAQVEIASQVFGASESAGDFSIKLEVPMDFMKSADKAEALYREWYPSVNAQQSFKGGTWSSLSAKEREQYTERFFSIQKSGTVVTEKGGKKKKLVKKLVVTPRRRYNKNFETGRYIGTGTVTMTSMSMSGHVFDTTTKPKQKGTVYAARRPFAESIGLQDLDKDEVVDKIFADGDIDLISSNDLGQRNTAAVFVAPMDTYKNPTGDRTGIGVQMILRERELKGPQKRLQRFLRQKKSTCKEVNIYRVETAIWEQGCKRTEHGIAATLCLFYGTRCIARETVAATIKRDAIIDRRVDLDIDEPARRLGKITNSYSPRVLNVIGSSDDRGWRSGAQSYKTYVRRSMRHSKNLRRRVRLPEADLPRERELVVARKIKVKKRTPDASVESDSTSDKVQEEFEEINVMKLRKKQRTWAFAPRQTFVRQNENLTTIPCPRCGETMTHPPRGDRVSICPKCGPVHRDGGAATSANSNAACAVLRNPARTYRR